MRRKTSILTSLALALAILVVPAAAHADTTVVSLQTEFDRLSVDRIAKVTLKAKSPSGITDVTADVTTAKAGVWTPFASLPFKRVDGTDNDGTWQAEFRSDIEGHPGVNLIPIQIKSADGATMKRYAGFANCYQMSITDFAAAPTTIDFDRDVIVNGRLRVQKTHDSAPEPVAGATVKAGEVVGQSASDGSFRISTKRTGAVEARTHDGKCSAFASATMNRLKQDTVTSAQVITAQPMPTDGWVGVQGKVMRNAASGLVPASDVYVDVHLDGPSGTDVIASGHTSADGTFLLWGRPGGSGTVSVETSATSFLNASQAEAGAVTLRTATKINDFVAGPTPLPYGDSLLTKGNLTEANGMAIVGVPIVLEYSADGKTGWRTIETFHLPHSHEFSPSADPVTSDGYWRTRFAGNADYLPAVSSVEYVNVMYRMHIYNFNASPEPVKKGKLITVKGLLHRFMARVLSASGAPIYIYFKASGSTMWKQMAVTKTGKDGWFRKKFKASKDGLWMATYKGNTNDLKTVSHNDFVDVR